MKSDKDIYDKYFFDRAREMEKSSAKSVVDILMEYFNPQSVIDIGCGIGNYLKEFADRGVEILGYDGSLAAIDNSLVGDRIKLHDFRIPLVLDRKFDLCLSIEVAEHLPEESADTFVATLERLSDTVIFTAATPGQGSLEIGHINEQPHRYWIEKFEKAGFFFDEKLRNDIWKKMIEKGVIWWVTKNLMIFKKQY